MNIFNKLCGSIEMVFIWFLKALYRSFSKPKLSVGDIFIFDDYDRNPFAREPQKVQVLAIKKDYVNYKFIGLNFFQDESLSIRQFNFCYKKV